MTISADRPNHNKHTEAVYGAMIEILCKALPHLVNITLRAISYVKVKNDDMFAKIEKMNHYYLLHIFRREAFLFSILINDL